MRYHLPAELGRGRAAAPRCWPTAAPEQPASMSAGLFGSTTVAIPPMELLQEWEWTK